LPEIAAEQDLLVEVKEVNGQTFNRPRHPGDGRALARMMKAAGAGDHHDLERPVERRAGLASRAP
jgi:hypothetical protein